MHASLCLFVNLVILVSNVSVIELYIAKWLTDAADATRSYGADIQYSSRFEKERADLNAMQYSSRSQPRERLEMGNFDSRTHAQYKIDAERTASKTVGSSSYRSGAENLKPVSSGLTDRVTSDRPVDGRYVDFAKPSSSQKPYIQRPDFSGRDQLTPTSAKNKQYPTVTGNDNRPMNFDRNHRMDDSLYIKRQMPDASYAGPVGKYQPPNATQYSHRERRPPSPEVEMAQNRLGGAVKNYSLPGEEELRKTLYDKKYQMEVQKKQADMLGGYKLQREIGELEQRGTGQRLDSPRGMYGMGYGTESERIESANRRLHNADKTRLSSTYLASSSKLESSHEIAKSTDLPTARKQFTKAERGRVDVSGRVERDEGYSRLKDKLTPKATVPLKDDYYRDYHRDRELVSSTRKHVQIDERQPSTMSSHERFQQQNEKRSAMNNDSKFQTGLSNSSAIRKAEDHRQASERESSFSLQKMKEDLLRDQAKLDRQLMANDMVSNGRTPRFDNQHHYDTGRYSDIYNTDYGQSSFATNERMVWLHRYIFFFVFYYK